MTQIMAGLGLLGAPASQGGFGDEQAMRITMLVALLGGRISEICLLDRDPLLPLLPAPSQPAPSAVTDSQAPVARLRYQQTKIDGAPDTVLVHAEVVAIIREQQDWADRFFAERGAPGKTPKYLFLAALMNRNGDRPYSGGRLRDLLSELARRLDVRDAAGVLVDFNRTHRFRHTVATSLLNTGVPIHVVQRYLGHLSPAMTMHYAQTLQSTAEAEFLKYRKLTADARELGTDPTDLYDLLQLDRRTDRMLPNGYCLLPPRQVCDKGNACLTCDKFATDATFLPELTSQLNRTGQLVETRQAAFLARTGTPMGEDNVWLAGRGPSRTRCAPSSPNWSATRTQPTRSRSAAPGRPPAQTRSSPPGRKPMTQDRPGDTANLKAAAARRHQAAAQRAEAGLDKPIRSEEQVTFRAVARAFGVSLEFLYSHPPIRSRIGTSAPSRTPPRPPAPRPAPASPARPAASSAPSPPS